ncbi:MAG: four helix bundle protein [Coraliomargaritaceae bacterium]
MGSRFQDLELWQRSKALVVDVCKYFDSSRNFGLRDQIMRSAISVPSNIAEGAERNSSKKFSLFIVYAKGSLAELRTQLMIAAELGEISQSDSD